MRICLAVILYFFINSNSLNAHELWLEADQYKLKSGGKLIVNIKVGQDLVEKVILFVKTENFFISKKGLEN